MWKSGCLHGLDLDVTSTGPRKKYLDLDFWMSDLDFWMSGGPKSGCLDFLDLDVVVPGPRRNIWIWMFAWARTWTWMPAWTQTWTCPVWPPWHHGTIRHAPGKGKHTITVMCPFVYHLRAVCAKPGVELATRPGSK